MNKLLLIALIVIPLQIMPIQTIAQDTQQVAKRITVTQLEKFDPVKQIPLAGYQLRARKIVVPAGMSIAEHAHKTRPGIVYVESGEIIEYRGEESRLLKKGDSVVEDVTTLHAYKNASDAECVLIAFDVPLQ